jgi:hypothetical protein
MGGFEKPHCHPALTKWWSKYTPAEGEVRLLLILHDVFNEL